VRTILNQPAAFDGDDAIRHAQRGEPVRDDKHGPRARYLRHILLNDVFALVVERARRFIENEDAGIGDQSAGNGDPLPLSSRQAATALADDGIIALGKLENELVRAGQRRGRYDTFGREGRVRQRDIVPDRPVEQDVVLQDHADLAA
jgi:hypothetical protein